MNSEFSENQALALAFIGFSFLLFFTIVIFKNVSRANKYREAEEFIRVNFPHWKLYAGMDLIGVMSPERLTEGEAMQILNKAQKYAMFYKYEFCPIGSEQIVYLYTEEVRNNKKEGKWFFFAFTKRSQNKFRK